MHADDEPVASKKFIALYFSAHWCPPCRKEMPDLAAIQSQFAALGVQVIGAAADSARPRPRRRAGG